MFSGTRDFSVNFLFTFNGDTKVVQAQQQEVEEDCSFFYEKVWDLFGIPPAQQCLRVNNVLLTSCGEVFSVNHSASAAVIQNGCPADTVGERRVYGRGTDHPSPFVTVQVTGRLLGGKGGFGSLLRGQRGARKKIRNFDACRDLNGRRLRYAKSVERLTAWLAKKQRDKALVEALGGDVTESEPKNRPEPRNAEGHHKLNASIQRVGEVYFRELERALDATKEAVEEALSKRHLMPKPVTSSSSSSQDSHSSGLLKGELQAGTLPAADHKLLQRRTDYLNSQLITAVSCSGDVSSSDSDDSQDDVQKNADTASSRCTTHGRFSSLLQKISLKENQGSAYSQSLPPIKPIGRRKKKPCADGILQGSVHAHSVSGSVDGKAALPHVSASLLCGDTSNVDRQAEPAPGSSAMADEEEVYIDL